MNNISDFIEFGAESIAEELVDINARHLLKDTISGYGMKQRIVVVLDALKAALFPTLYEKVKTPDQLPAIVSKHLSNAAKELTTIVRDVLVNSCEQAEKDACNHEDCISHADEVTVRFLNELVNIRRLLTLDVQAAYEGDPGTEHIEEILLCYPSIEAVSTYRMAHFFYEAGIPLIPRMMTEHAHMLTGIDIHPGAKIGTHFFIDHGTGVVIGETTVIGNHVKLYQGVTLGARSFELDEEGNPIKGVKRHPNIEDNVIIYSGASILGGDTTIGTGSIIGSNVWLMESVPPNSTVLTSTPRPKVRVNE